MCWLFPKQRLHLVTDMQSQEWRWDRHAQGLPELLDCAPHTDVSRPQSRLPRLQRLWDQHALLHAPGTAVAMRALALSPRHIAMCGICRTASRLAPQAGPMVDVPALDT